MCIHILLVLIQQADTLLLNWETWFSLLNSVLHLSALLHVTEFTSWWANFSLPKVRAKRLYSCLALPILQFWKALFHYENLDINGSFEKNVKNKSYIIKGSCLLFVCESNLPSYPDISDIRKWFTFDTREKCV